MLPNLKKEKNLCVSYWIISTDLSSGSLTYPSVSALLLNLSSRFSKCSRLRSIYFCFYLLAEISSPDSL